MDTNEIFEEIIALLKKAEPEELGWIYAFLQAYFAEKLRKRP